MISSSIFPFCNEFSVYFLVSTSIADCFLTLAGFLFLDTFGLVELTGTEVFPSEDSCVTAHMWDKLMNKCTDNKDY